MNYNPETGLGVVDTYRNPHSTNRFKYRHLIPDGGEIVEQKGETSCVFRLELLGRERHFLIVTNLTRHAKQDVQFSITELSYP
jgi:hypothetical protein